MAKIIEFAPDADDIKVLSDYLDKAKAAAEEYGVDGALIIMVGRETWVGGFTRDTRTKERLLGVIGVQAARMANEMLDVDVEDLPDGE